MAGDRAVRAFDSTTGRERWRLPAATPVQAVEPLGAGLVGVALRAADLVAVDLATGAIRWRAPIGGALSVAASGERLAVATVDGLVVLARADVGDVWTRTDDAGHFEVTLRGAGRVTAQVDPRDASARCAWSAPVTAVLRGRPRLRLRVARDHCACHDCD